VKEFKALFREKVRDDTTDQQRAQQRTNDDAKDFLVRAFKLTYIILDFSQNQSDFTKIPGDIIHVYSYARLITDIT
jgi:hypothetical protein